MVSLPNPRIHSDLSLIVDSALGALSWLMKSWTISVVRRSI